MGNRSARAKLQRRLPLFFHTMVCPVACTLPRVLKRKKLSIDFRLELSDCNFMLQFFGTYGGHICGLIGFLTALAALLYTRARVAEFEKSVKDLDWQRVSELSLDVAKLIKASQKWQNNVNAQQKVNQKQLLEQAYMERLMAQPNNVKQITGGEF